VNRLQRKTSADVRSPGFCIGRLSVHLARTKPDGNPSPGTLGHFLLPWRLCAATVTVGFLSPASGGRRLADTSEGRRRRLLPAALPPFLYSIFPLHTSRDREGHRPWCAVEGGGRIRWPASRKRRRGATPPALDRGPLLFSFFPLHLPSPIHL
jgi:hypothetical protein